MSNFFRSCLKNCLVLFLGMLLFSPHAFAQNLSPENNPGQEGPTGQVDVPHLLWVLEQPAGLYPAADASKFNGIVRIGGAEEGLRGVLQIGNRAADNLDSIRTTLSNNAIIITPHSYWQDKYFPGLVWSVGNKNKEKPQMGIWGQMIGTSSDPTGSKMFFGTSNNPSVGITNQALTIDQNGRVGIGTTTPSGSSMAHISGGNDSMALFGPNANWSGNLWVGAGTSRFGTNTAQVISTDGNLHLDAGTNNHLYLGYYNPTDTYINPQGGNVGIGTTSPGVYKLNVNGKTYLGANSTLLAGSESWGEGFNIDSPPDIWGGIKWRRTNRSGSVGNWHLGYMANDGDNKLYLWEGNDSKAVATFQHNGNVGIGTTSPTQGKLVVSGNISIDNAAMGTGGSGRSGYGIAFPSTANDAQYVYGEHNSGDTSNLIFHQRDNSDDGVIFRNTDWDSKTNPQQLDYMKISRAGAWYVGEGNVGIGTTSPTQGKLVVSGGNIAMNTSGNAFVDLGANNRFRFCGPNGACSTAGEYIGGRIRLSPDGGFAKAEALVDPGMGGINAPGNVYVGGKVGIGITNPDTQLTVNAPANTWKAKFQGPDGYIVIGPANSGWAHIYTDRANFIFNTDVWSIPGGFSSYSTADLSLKTNGTTRLTIKNADGNVGIGKSPGNGYKLDVNGTINAEDIKIKGAAISTSQWTTTGSDIYYNTGKVGIGTVTPASRLHVKARGAGWQDHVVLEGSDAGSAWNVLVDSGMQNVSDNALRFKYHTGSEALTLLTNGNVGIGTTSPVSPLTVYNSSNVGPKLTLAAPGVGSSPGIDFRPYQNESQWSTNPAQASIWATDNYYSADIHFATKIPNALGNDLAERMIIKNDGNVGIGTTTPGAGYKLDVNGTINALNIKINGTAIQTSQWATSGDNIAYWTGNVGIGVNHRSEKLSVNGGIDLLDGQITFGGTNSNFNIKNESQGGAVSITTRGVNGAMKDNALFVSNTGAVGIGTTVPVTPLTVYNSSNVGPKLTLAAPGVGSSPGIDFRPYQNESQWSTNPAQASIWATDNYYSADIHFATKDPGPTGNSLSDRMVIKNYGNVGIGIGNPQAKLQIEGRGTSGGLAIKNENGSYTHFNYPDGKNYLRGATVIADNDPTAYVGIGTPSPGAKLDVVGNIRASDSGSFGKQGTGYNPNSTMVNRLVLYPPGSTDGPWNFRTRDTSSSSYLSFIYGNEELKGLIISKHGDVGIGTTPHSAYKLDVAGTINTSLPADATFAEKDGNHVAFSQDKIGLDIAELYNTTEDVEPGDILVVGGNNKLKKSFGRYQQDIIGIVSSAPAITFEGSELKIAPKPGIFTRGTKPPVALAGRVPVKVSLENGAIHAGDYLTTSSSRGVAMKATKPGMTIGIALESFAGETSDNKIMVFVNTGEKNSAKTIEELQRRLERLERKVK